MSEQQDKTKKNVRVETLQQFCDRWQLPISWGYRYTRLEGPEGLPHVKAGKYIRVIPDVGDAWMMDRGV